MEMKSISFLNFQADEYFELITTKMNEHALSRLVNNACCISTDPRQDSLDRLVDVSTPPDVEDLGVDLAEVSSVVQKCADRTLQHPAVTSVPQRIQFDVRQELAAYLQAQITSAACRSSDADARTKGKSLFKWVRKLGAEDTSCPYPFAFYMPLSIWTVQEEWKSDPSREYMLEALCGHLATMQDVQRLRVVRKGP
jgi:hypothetical protein